MRLRWKKNDRERGLARVGAGPRGSVLRDGTTIYATVNASGGGWRPLRGWYFVTMQDVTGRWVNTCNDLVPDEATAKANALACVKAQLAAKAATGEGAA
jgi:hypothetical protein